MSWKSLLSRWENRPKASNGFFYWKDFRPAAIKNGPDSSFATELIVYHKNLDEMRQHYDGMYVLIKGKKINGYYRTRSEAIAAAFRIHGRTPSLIKLIAEKSPIHRISGTLR